MMDLLSYCLNAHSRDYCQYNSCGIHCDTSQPLIQRFYPCNLCILLVRGDHCGTSQPPIQRCLALHSLYSTSKRRSLWH